MALSTRLLKRGRPMHTESASMGAPVLLQCSGSFLLQVSSLLCSLGRRDQLCPVALRLSCDEAPGRALSALGWARCCGCRTDGFHGPRLNVPSVLQAQLSREAVGLTCRLVTGPLAAGRLCGAPGGPGRPIPLGRRSLLPVRLLVGEDERWLEPGVSAALDARWTLELG